TAFLSVSRLVSDSLLNQNHPNRQLKQSLNARDGKESLAYYYLQASSACLQYSRQRFTSSIVSLPLYSYSIFAGIAQCLSRNNASTGFIGVSPSPNGTFSP